MKKKIRWEVKKILEKENTVSVEIECEERLKKRNGAIRYNCWEGKDCLFGLLLFISTNWTILDFSSSEVMAQLENIELQSLKYLKYGYYVEVR